MKKYFFFLFTLIFYSFLFGQEIDSSFFHGMNARSIGPAGMSGRVTAIDVSRINPDIIYAGTASGGLWLSENGGLTWKPLFDKQPLASIGAVKIDPKRPGIIWVGTGEGNPRNSQSSGNGVYKSYDGGKTWENIGLENTRNIHRILIDPLNPDIVYIGAQGSAWGESEERGVFKTIDGGKTWGKILYINKTTGIADLVMDPVNPEKIIAAMWEFRRYPWYFESGGEGSGIFITFDGGENWSRKSDNDGLPKGNLGRIGLAISQSNPEVVYALVESEKSAFYKSSDGGGKWTKTTDKNFGNRPFYYAEIFVDPINENRIYSIYSTVNVSEDGGKHFEAFLGWKVHPDHHAWFIHPNDPSFIINGNDGGMAITRDRGKTWQFIENLPLGQFYHINYDLDFPYNVYGGMQDNGSWKGPSRVFRSGGIQNSEWEEVGFGDGFDVVPYPKNSRFGYGMSQGGSLYRYDTETGGAADIKPLHPDGLKLRFNWNAAIAQDPFNDESIYYGSQFLHKSTDMGNSWSIISPDLTTNDSSKQKQDSSGGLTLDVTDAENFTTITSIAPSSLNQNVIWIGTDDGNIQLTKDGGKTWTNTAINIEDIPQFAWVPQIRASVYNESEAFAVINNYRQDDWTPYVFYTKDYGETWERIVDSDDVFGYALSFIQDTKEPNLFFCGTESGLYFSLNAGGKWMKWSNGFPNVSTMDLQIHPRENDLIIGTFGRAAYIIDDISALRELAKTRGEIQSALSLLPVKDGFQMDYKRPPGARFGADAQFRGENYDYGSMITYIMNYDSLNKKDSVKIEILNEENNIVRTILKSPENGINRFFWRLDSKGVRFPGSSKPKNDDEERGGGFLLPGKYIIRISYNNESFTQTMNVKSDFRKNIDFINLDARKALLDKFIPSINEVTNAADEMRKMKESLKLISGRLKEKTDSSFKELKNQVKEIQDSLNTIWNLVFQENEGKQGITAYEENKVEARLRTAYWTLTGGETAPGQREEIVLKLADQSVSGFLNKFHEFENNKWKVFKETILKSDLSFF